MDRAAQGDVAAQAPSAYASQMVYDSIVHAPKALRFLIDLVGLDNVVLGTDYSFPPADMEPLALLRSAGLSDGARSRRSPTAIRAASLRACADDGVAADYADANPPYDYEDVGRAG